MSENLRIWDKVSRTNPAHTKKVNQRGGFTAISAHYQVKAATEAFGPIGVGWGYTASEPIILGDFVSVGVTLWHGSRENTFGPVWGGADLKDSKGKTDSDAPKKAGTDGLTKGLSQLGFNADVFLGRFDDNKYVAQMEREFAEAANDPIPASVLTMIDGLKQAFDSGTEAEYWTAHWPAIPKDHRPRVLAEKEQLKAGRQLLQTATAG